MKKNNNVSKIVISVLVILVLTLIGSNFYFYNPIEEKALLKVDMYNWGYNIENDNELLFNYWILNYGDVEAQEIQVRCKITDKYEKLIFSGIDYYGNLASNSNSFGEFSSQRQTPSNQDMEYMGFCYVESCENCEILHEKIPELNDVYIQN